MLADLDLLRARLGTDQRVTRDDAILSSSLEVAKSWVEFRVYASSLPTPEVQEAILLMASRLYKRRQSPEGIAGWDDLGVVRILSNDPDINNLLSAHIDTYKMMGIG